VSSANGPMKAFECKKCGTCCYGKGGITLESREVKEISVFLQISRESFLRRYCEKRNGKLSIRAGTDGYCLFFRKEKQCLIHPVKPRPCSLWPFYPALLKDRANWEMAKEACPGINTEGSFEDFVRESEE